METHLTYSQRRESDNIEHTGQVLTLGDGRKLGYAEYGDRAGDPVFYFHGSPGSRLEAAAWHETAVRMNVRIIAVDRPGMGLSAFQNNRCIKDFPEDVGELADSLNIDNFSIVGMSGGGPYVLACAYKLPSRVNAAGILSGIGMDKPDAEEDDIVFSTRFTEWLSCSAPWLMGILFGLISIRLRRSRELFFWKSLPGPDRAALDISSISNTWVDSILEAFHFGTKGPVKDLKLIKQPWGFDPGDINIQVFLWHGQLDRNVSPAQAKMLAERIPNCKAYLYPHEGHLSMWLNHMEEILKTMVSHSHEYTDTNARDLVTSI